MRTLQLTLAYDGTAYVGWQRQADGTSIQGLIEAAVARIEGEAVTVTGAGRTDAGVHALGQVASVDVASTIACEAYARALNAVLPIDVRVRGVAEAPLGFHARFSARAKTYRYRVLHAPVASPFEARFAWHVTHALDRSAMRAALDACRGRHDFAAFQATGSGVRDTVRTITAARLIEAGPDLQAHPAARAPAFWGEDAPSEALPMNERPAGDAPSDGAPSDGAPTGGAWPDRAPSSGGASKGRPPLLILEVTGDGFLRHMVRTLVGTLVDIGRGRWSSSEMPAILASRDRARAGPTAPPQGLFLVAVEYEAPSQAEGRPGVPPGEPAGKPAGRRPDGESGPE